MLLKLDENNYIQGYAIIGGLEGAIEFIICWRNGLTIVINKPKQAEIQPTTVAIFLKISIVIYSLN